jgi:hypothetical protein
VAVLNRNEWPVSPEYPANGYGHSEGYPPFPEKAKFIGNLKGNWYDIGRQLGEKAGEDTRFVSDIWWNDECELWGKAEILKAFTLYESQIEAFQPGLIDFMKGIAEGASAWLDQSPYANPEHKLHATNYQRVLAANRWDAWTMMHPRVFPDGSSTHGGMRNPPPPEARCVAGAAEKRISYPPILMLSTEKVGQPTD